MTENTNYSIIQLIYYTNKSFKNTTITLNKPLKLCDLDLVMINNILRKLSSKVKSRY